MSSASFRKIGFFGPGRRLAAPEAPKIAGGPRWREGKSLIPGHPKEEGFLELEAEPWGGKVGRPRADANVPICSWELLAASLGGKECQESLREAPGGSERLQEPEGRPRSSSEMSGASFRKIRFFRPGRRLAAPEGPKIAGGASLARRRKARFSARL